MITRTAAPVRAGRSAGSSGMTYLRPLSELTTSAYGSSSEARYASGASPGPSVVCVRRACAGTTENQVTGG